MIKTLFVILVVLLVAGCATPRDTRGSELADTAERIYFEADCWIEELTITENTTRLRCYKENQ